MLKGEILGKLRREPALRAESAGLDPNPGGTTDMFVRPEPTAQGFFCPVGRN